MWFFVLLSEVTGLSSLEMKYLFFVRVVGDSMEPTLKESYTVLINNNDSTIRAGGGIFAVNWDNKVLVKHLQMNPQTNEIIIKSGNLNYDSMIVKPNEIQIGGKVIWYGRELSRFSSIICISI